MLSVLITRDMCNERKKCTHHRAGPGSSSHIVTILAADLRPSDTTQISYIQQIYLFQSVFLVGLEVHTDWIIKRYSLYIGSIAIHGSQITNSIVYWLYNRTSKKDEKKSLTSSNPLIFCSFSVWHENLPCYCNFKFLKMKKIFTI